MGRRKEDEKLKKRENFRLIFKASALLIVEHNKEDI